MKFKSLLITLSAQVTSRRCRSASETRRKAAPGFRRVLRADPLEPRQLLAADLVGHWRADTLDSEIEDGEVVPAWTDAIDGIAAEAAGRPTLVKGALNGRSVIRFDKSDGTDSFQVPAAASPMSGADDFSVVVVFATNSRGIVGNNTSWLGNTRLVDATRFFGATSEWSLTLNASGRVGAGLGAPLITQFSNERGLNDGSPHVAVYTRGGPLVRLSIDGAPPASRSDGSLAARDPINMTFGASSMTGSGYTGDIAEIRFYDDDLTEVEVAALSSQLLDTYRSPPPVAVDDAYRVDEDGVLRVGPDDGVLRNDSGGDLVTTAAVETPRHGELALEADGSFVYTPDPEFFGLDSFQYVSADYRESAAATVRIEVAAIDDPPATLPDGYHVATDQARAVPAELGLLANDHDIDSDEPLTARVVDRPAHGTLWLADNGAFLYEPRQGFHGVDSFTYVAGNQLESPLTSVDLYVGESPVEISEFMAANGSTLRTRLRDSAEAEFPQDQWLSADWIEVRNRTGRAVSLGSFYLTDNLKTPLKWRFPAGSIIAPHGFFMVFASGADIADARLDEHGYPHTSFRLDDAGEPLAIVFDDATLADRFAPTFPRQFPDISFGLRDGTAGYLAEPTPGGPNRELLAGIVDEVIFSHARGFYDAPFEVALSVPSDGATIFYTLDGSRPNPETSPAYSEPIAITGTTTVRAAAFRPGYVPVRPVTQTYLFTGDTLRQPADPAGFPAVWGPAGEADYGVDPRVATDRASEFFDPRVADALRALPTISITVDVDDFFGSESGIQSFPQQHGDQWERPTSVEFLDFGSFPDTQIDAGIRMVGNASRSPNRRKHNMRLAFRDDYGFSDLHLPLFGTGGDEVHDNLILSGDNGDSWVNPGTYRRAQYIRDEWQRDVQAAMGYEITEQRRAHLYINGLYWGLYRIIERFDGSFMARHFGGDAQDYDVIKDVNGATDQVDPIDGDTAAWTELMRIVQSTLPPAEKYAEVQRRVDVDNMIDYLLINFYAGSTDWDHNNFRTARRRDPSGKFMFFTWDGERADLNGTNDRGTGPVELRPGDIDRDVTTKSQAGRPTRIHQMLRDSAEYRLRFADRVQKQFFDGGPLSPERASAIWNARAAEIRLPLVAESARWGDLQTREGTPRTVDDWQEVLDLMNEAFFPVRTGIVLEQLRQQGFFPELDAPRLSAAGGDVPPDFELAVTAPRGVIYLTTDGSDPRAVGGQVADTAKRFTRPLRLNRSQTIKARVREGDVWSALTEARFRVAVPASAANLRISEVHYHPASPTKEEAAAGFTDADEFEFIELVNPSDLPVGLRQVALIKNQGEGVAFSFGDSRVRELGPGERVVVAENAEAFAARYGDAVPVAGQWSGQLSNKRERLTLVSAGQLLMQFEYRDDWYPATDGGGASLEIIDATQADVATWSLAASWQASSVKGGTPGSSAVLGDFRGDGRVGVDDVELLQSQVRFAANSASFDLTRDGRVDQRDMEELVESILHTNYGDTDLDGDVDSDDVDAAFRGFAERGGSDASWRHGDFDGDADVDNLDLMQLIAHFTVSLLDRER